MTDDATSDTEVCHGTWSHEDVEMEPVDETELGTDLQCPKCGVVVRVE